MMSVITHKVMEEIMGRVAYDRPPMFDSLKVYEQAQPPAKLSLSKKLDVDSEFRAKYDAWLLARFGRLEPMGGRDFFISEHYDCVIAPPGGTALLNVMA